FRHMKDFSPEHVTRQVPRLQAMLTMRSLLKDLRANLLDDVSFRRELLEILRNPDLSDELRAEIAALAPQDI
ncbi:type VI secretion system contractile sheath small subunit, partial [Enterobacter ludwigii]|uniref:type VI secretion system contractile sheath small subunit n=1 Tax=Enterobacter ludwigii TaxID=299767 RepID=UPI003F70FE9B